MSEDIIFRGGKSFKIVRHLAVPPRTWIKQIFRARAARNGGIIRRKVSNVKKYASLGELKKEVKAREFHLLQVDDQYVIICNKGDLKTIC